MLDNAHNACYTDNRGEGMTFREVEALLLKDGWVYKNSKGSHNHYIRPIKKGKVTIPMHRGDVDSRTLQSILKQAGLRH